MPRSPLTEQYQRVMSLVEQLHALAEDERNFILDLLVPQAEAEQPVKKPRKKASKKAGSKSSRAAGLQSQLKASLHAQQRVTSGKCTFVLNDATSEQCEAVQDDPIHDPTYSSSHVFQSVSPLARGAGGD